ncbi:Uu.00g082100.m01.CDS01 [Anthostomella pinea]|uniref:Uu.00g082100.m01.CDS01 n=1 Tax=Anthostomella pinea TaxID=933095 RepID=A0AAI8VLC0_9PEZI|nr:Uu.00g082100.m01.CDS01 [Anthostomella pinea]
MKLHALARQWLAMLKDLGDMDEHIVRIRRLRDDSERSMGTTLTVEKATSRPLDNPFDELQSTCHFWTQWARTYAERTNIQINLMHHIATQKDSRANQEISHLTTDIAVRAQRENVSMFTLAIVTAVFLPGTFVSSVLSTVFFSYDGSLLSISQLWWTLPVVVVPLTFIVLYLWFRWVQNLLKRHSTAALEKRRAELEATIAKREE